MRIIWTVLFVAAACGDDGGGAASSRDGVVAAWKKGGITVSPLTDAKVAFGKDCKSGTANAVDVLLCQYPSPTEAKAAEEPALVWVGDATGMTKSVGPVLIAAADRRKTDPQGKTINSLMKLPAGKK